MLVMTLIFLLVLVLSFGVIALVTRPTAAERTIEGRIVDPEREAEVRRHPGRPRLPRSSSRHA